MKTTIIKNLSILISFGLMVKILGLFNKIILSRTLEIEGLTLYTKLIPIAGLFMTLASFSLGPVITQIVSKNISKRPYSNHNLIKKGFITATTTSSIVSIIHLALNFVICHYLLRMDILIKPFIFFIPLYYLQSYTSIFKGYFHGHNKMETYALGQLIEQIFRILLLYIYVKPQLEKSVIDGVIAAILTLSISELIQNIYLFIRVLMFTKIKKTTNIETEYKEIIKPSLNLTLNKLFGSVTAFLEPIIFTYAFLKTGLSTVIADELYAVIYGYSIPIILTTNFISIAIETAILPTLTKLHIENNKKELNNIVKKALLLSFIPAVIISFIYFNFSYEIMEFFYKTTKGAYYIKLMAIPSFFAYFEGVFISLLIATKNEKTLVKNTIFTNILHLLLIYIFVSIPKINALGIIYSFSIVMILSPIVLYCFSVKNTPFSLKKRILVLFLVIYALFMSLTFLL